jgi:hypothetical protein
MKSAAIKGIIAIGVAASIALFGAVSTAEAGKGKGGGGGFKGGGSFRGSSHSFKGGGSFRGSSYAFKGGGSKFRGAPNFHTGNKALRYGGGNIARYGKPNYAFAKKGYGKSNYNFAKKGHGNYLPYQRYGKYPYYRRYANYGWYGLPLYSYGGSCGWLYRNAIATGSDYWWDRYYRCTRYSY